MAKEQPQIDRPGEAAAEACEGALTGIGTAYTLSTAKPDDHEVDALMVNQFLRALAEVALAVASRTVKQ